MLVSITSLGIVFSIKSFTKWQALQLIYAGRRLLPINSVVTPPKGCLYSLPENMSLKYSSEGRRPPKKCQELDIYRFVGDEDDDKEDVKDYDI